MDAATRQCCIQHSSTLAVFACLVSDLAVTISGMIANRVHERKLLTAVGRIMVCSADCSMNADAANCYQLQVYILL